MDRARRALIILTFNECDGVAAQIPILPLDSVDEVLAVDGGSTDGTCEILKRHGVKIIGQDRRGRGEAFRVAMDNTKADQLVYFSPDGNEDPDDIPKLFQLLDAGADMAIASRFQPESRNEEDDLWLPLRKWTNMAFTLMANTLWNGGRPYVTDTINGFRGITREAFQAISPVSMGYTIEYELSIKSMKRRLDIRELPTLEGNRIGGESKAPSFRTGVTFTKFFLSQVFAGVEEPVTLKLPADPAETVTRKAA
jgi:glycosyltransferase involved in cell wall biosynthesis